MQPRAIFCIARISKKKQIASVKTTVDLDDELHAKVQTAAGLIGEKPATVLRLAIREGLPVLTEKFQRHPPEGYFADAYGDSERIAFEKAVGAAVVQRPER